MTCFLFAASIERTGQHQLTHDASYLVAFGERGEVVLGDRTDICVYQHDGVKFSISKKTRIPDGVWSFCNKAVSDTSVFLQKNIYHDSNIPTHQLHLTDLHHMGTVDHQGKLCGTLYPSTLVYAHKRANGYWVIILHQPDGELILQPPHGHHWKEYLSVCRAGKYVVVVERLESSLDVFTISGNIILLSCHMSPDIDL